MAKDEQVWVVDRSAFFGGNWPQEFVPLEEQAGIRLVAAVESVGRFESRARAEDEPRWKQCIPYCVVRHGEEVLCVERRTTQGESRLHGRISIGIGGHIGEEDDHPPGLLLRGLCRELCEELVLDPRIAGRARLIGLLNDDSNPVGRVHFGMVYVLNLEPDDPRPQVREISKMQGSFRRLAGSGEAWQDAARLESWSAALITHLAPELHHET